MNITITARRITVRDTLREKIETKLSKFDRYFGTDTTAKVVLSSEKDRHTMEITLSLIHIYIGHAEGVHRIEDGEHRDKTGGVAVEAEQA